MFLQTSSVFTEAVAEMCEEYESFSRVDQVQLEVVMGQSSSSLVLSEIKTEVLCENDDPGNQNFLLQQYEETN